MTTSTISGSLPPVKEFDALNNKCESENSNHQCEYDPAKYFNGVVKDKCEPAKSIILSKCEHLMQ